MDYPFYLVDVAAADALNCCITRIGDIIWLIFYPRSSNAA